MAGIAGVPPADFIRLWYATFDDRITGRSPTPQANFELVCGRLGVTATSAQREEAAHMRLDLTRRTFVPVAGAVDTLAKVRALGHRTALVSDSSSEVPALWKETPFAPLIDVTVFSCLLGFKKPDPRMYLTAASQLGVKTGECLYVGDGSSRELTGAAAVGMHPVLVRDPSEDTAAIHRVEAEGEAWRGPVISSLPEVLKLL